MIVSQLSFARQQQPPLFEQLSFTLSPGELLCIEGVNGSGKSSLLRILAGLMQPNTGDICWQGVSIHHPLALFKTQMHYVGHANGIKLDLTVNENLRLTNALSTALASQETLSLLKQLQLHTQQQTLARYLSAGQKRRLALAKLWLTSKKLWLLDEPLTALDANTQTFFLAQLTQHLQQGGMAIMSSHQPIRLATNVQQKTIRLSVCG
ncbi:MAG TPA: cytochrome c biogenesis heme-transporting ATPase CcmA [Gammaproteobacteria bacterium]|jgi:heme exporter protein A|nr:cytochrome c biogenesis heme-transporting ATPase CcmA [Gammaproteobacteria bacterium]